MSVRNKVLDALCPVVRLITLIIIAFSLLIARSIYLILLITTFLLILAIHSNKSIKTYLKILKKYSIILFIFTLVYIIIFREYSVFHSSIFVLKLILLLIAMYIFSICFEFDELHEAIHGVLIPFKAFNIEKISYDIAISLYMIKFFFDSKQEIRNKHNNNQRFGFVIFSPMRIIYMVNRADRLQTKLKLNHYNLKHNNFNTKSKFWLVFVILFLIVCIIKEVIF